MSAVYPPSIAKAALRLPVRRTASAISAVPARAPPAHCNAISMAAKRSRLGSAPVRIHSLSAEAYRAVIGMVLG